MSIKIMSAIFETEFFDLPLPHEEGQEKARMAKASSVKLVMLALADHANDDGECYPGLSRLETKTALSRQGLVDVLSAIRNNGLAFVSDEPSRLGSNLYTINLDCFPKMSDKDGNRLLVKPLDYPSQATLLELVKPLDYNHQLTIIEPSMAVEQSPAASVQESKKEVPSNYPIEWQIGAGNTTVVQRDEKEVQMMDAANLIATGIKGINYHLAYGIAYTFMKTRGIVIGESKIKSQRKPVREMIESGVLSNHVQEATKKLMEANMTVTDLYSIVRTSIDIANKPVAESRDVDYDSSGVPMSY